MGRGRHYSFAELRGVTTFGDHRPFVLVYLWPDPHILYNMQEPFISSLAMPAFSALKKADLVVFHAGAHFKGEDKMKDYLDEWWGRGLGDVAARNGLIWLQTPASHFPWGL